MVSPRLLCHLCAQWSWVISKSVGICVGFYTSANCDAMGVSLGGSSTSSANARRLSPLLDVEVTGTFWRTTVAARSTIPRMLDPNCIMASHITSCAEIRTQTCILLIHTYTSAVQLAPTKRGPMRLSVNKYIPDGEGGKSRLLLRSFSPTSISASLACPVLS